MGDGLQTVGAWRAWRLRSRWEWLSRRDGNRQWCALPSKREQAVLSIFNAATVSTLGDGESTFFWTDNWINGSSIRLLVPNVFAAVSGRKKKVVVAKAIGGRAWIRHITGPLTMQLLIEFVRLWEILEQGTSVAGGTGHLRLEAYSRPGVLGILSLRSYVLWRLHAGWCTSNLEDFGTASCEILFLALVMHGRCWTAERRFRHGLQDSDTCVICDQESETMDHIMLGCIYSQEVWDCWFRKQHLNDVVRVHQQKPLPETGPLPSARRFAECNMSRTWQRASLPSAALGKGRHSAKRWFAERLALGKD